MLAKEKGQVITWIYPVKARLEQIQIAIANFKFCVFIFYVYIEHHLFPTGSKNIFLSGKALFKYLHMPSLICGKV